MRILIERSVESRKQTLGRLYLLEENDNVVMSLDTLELPDKDNQRNISRIPEGVYTALIHYSNRFGKCLWLQDVEDRTEILVHSGNYYTDILGCILIGTDLQDINGDGYLDVINSRVAMNNLMIELIDKEEIEIEII